MRQVTKVIYSFARKIIKRTGQQLPITQLQNVEKRSIGLIDKDLEEEIVPFTASSEQPENFRKFQQRVKEKLVNQLKSSSSVDNPMGNILDEDYNNSRLVNRPNKGVVWGLGGQLMVADRKVHLIGVKDALDDIIEFLELHQVKDIYIHDFFKEDENTNRRRYSIIGSCFSAKHCWKTGLQLKNAFNMNSSVKFHKRTKKYDPIPAHLNGSKNQEWSMVTYKEFEVNLMTEEQREAADLEWKWNNPVSQEILDNHIRLKLRKGRKNLFQDL